MKILTASQMREVDLLSTSNFGIPGLILMENAGMGVVREMERHFGDLRGRSIAILCGKGNNGGDGFVIARQLIARGLQPRVLLFAAFEEVKGDAKANLEILQKMSYPITRQTDYSEESLSTLFVSLRHSIIVDGLLGTGTRLPIQGPLTAILQQLRQIPQIVSIDVPSGLDCESLRFTDQKIQAPVAELTVTFTAPKPAHIFPPAADFSTKWVVIPIGSPAALLESPEFYLNYFTETDANQALRPLRRSPASHKGTYGHVLALGGSMGKTGAASLMAKSALSAGAGLVTLATAASCLPIIASQNLEIMTEPLQNTENGAISHRAFEYGRMEQVLNGKDLLAIGPGLGTHQETVQFVRELLEMSRLPVVLDADGINAFSGKPEKLPVSGRLMVLTPHPGEFSRLVNRPTTEVMENRIELARQFARDYQLHLILKGHRTLYAAPSGQVYVNSTGNPGMATGGSGDVLTGIIAGLLVQALSRSIPVEPTLALAVYLHGLAGDLAASVSGEIALVASQLMEFLPCAFQQTSDLKEQE